MPTWLYLLKASWPVLGPPLERGLGAPTTSVLSGSQIQRWVGGRAGGVAGGGAHASPLVQGLHQMSFWQSKTIFQTRFPIWARPGGSVKHWLCCRLRRGRHRVGTPTRTPTGPGRLGPMRAEVGTGGTLPTDPRRWRSRGAQVRAVARPPGAYESSTTDA